ncbi:DeoR/GlpR family DNA-binding transcription regulator [Aestuariivirga sp.]|uniref:DeoR/GlpR family DNA-binding transcription regulator n=1 Tax=Aestuariivirga sp. TaxID=2650926 RepID=UPI0035930D27
MQRSKLRHAAILTLVRDRGNLTVANIAAALRVSQETIRRDLRPLAMAGQVVKLHGAVALPAEDSEAPYERRMRENSEAKRAVARHAARHVSDGDSLMLDTGTTTSIFARELLRKRNLTVVTNSSDIARTLATVNGNKVYMAGGELNGDNGAAFGVTAVGFVASFNVRHAFISIGAMDSETGATDSSLDEAEFARMLLKQGERRYVLTDSSKFGRRALIKVCEFSDIDVLITENPPPDDLAAGLLAANVVIDVAPQRGSVIR